MLGEAAVPSVGVHDALHTAARMMLLHEVPLEVIGTVLGSRSDRSPGARERRRWAAARCFLAHRRGVLRADDYANRNGRPSAQGAPMTVCAGQTWWGGWGSNPRPKDYESSALTG